MVSFWLHGIPVPAFFPAQRVRTADQLVRKAVPFGPIGRFKKLDVDDVREILRMSLS